MTLELAKINIYCTLIEVNFNSVAKKVIFLGHFLLMITLRNPSCKTEIFAWFFHLTVHQKRCARVNDRHKNKTEISFFTLTRSNSLFTSTGVHIIMMNNVVKEQWNCV